MKVAHFEDKPGRHEREERKAYIAAVLMANPKYLDSLAPMFILHLTSPLCLFLTCYLEKVEILQHLCLHVNFL